MNGLIFIVLLLNSRTSVKRLASMKPLTARDDAF
jgi:hypothetical protein